MHQSLKSSEEIKKKKKKLTSWSHSKRFCFDWFVVFLNHPRVSYEWQCLGKNALSKAVSQMLFPLYRCRN